MYCENCGTSVNAGVNFCPACGSKIPASGTSQPIPQREFASDRARQSSQKLQTIILVSVPALLSIVAALWFVSDSFTTRGSPVRTGITQLNRSSAAKLIKNSARFKDIKDTSITFSIGNGVCRGGVVPLAAAGYVRVVDDSAKGLCEASLTSKGEVASKSWSYDSKNNFWTAVIATREFLEVTGITQQSNHAQVSYNWKWNVTPFGQDLKQITRQKFRDPGLVHEAFDQYAEGILQESQTLILYDDGWRIP